MSSIANDLKVVVPQCPKTIADQGFSATRPT
jgi:hypothetical protein